MPLEIALKRPVFRSYHPTFPSRSIRCFRLIEGFILLFYYCVESEVINFFCIFPPEHEMSSKRVGPSR
jgi:hypothetical protein